MEVLLVTENVPEGNTSLTFWSSGTGTRLLSLKGPPAALNSLVLLKDEGVLVAEEGKGKPFIHLWQAGSPLQNSKRIICPVGQQKLGPMTASPDGNFLVVGISEKINVWQPASGSVVRILSSAHYRSITVLKMTDDGSYLVSAGADGIVSVWSFLHVVAVPNVKPVYSWSNHSLPVTSLHVGAGGRKATIFTASEDRFVKIYSLLTGTLCLSVAFPQPLSSLVVDLAERCLFAGGSGDGTIYALNISTPPRGLEHHVLNEGDVQGVLKKHSSRVSTMAISSDGKYLASGDVQGAVYIWDLESCQPVRSINTSMKGPITNLAFWLNDPELLKEGSGKLPTIAFPEVPKLIENTGDFPNDALYTVWTRVDSEDSSNDTNANEGQMSESTASEINQLKMKLAHATSVNRKLNQFCVEQLFDQVEMNEQDQVQAQTPSRKKQKTASSRDK